MATPRGPIGGGECGAQTHIGFRVTRIICVYSRGWGFLIGTSFQFLNINPASGANYPSRSDDLSGKAGLLDLLRAPYHKGFRV